MSLYFVEMPGFEPGSEKLPSRPLHVYLLYKSRLDIRQTTGIPSQSNICLAVRSAAPLLALLSDFDTFN